MTINEDDWLAAVGEAQRAEPAPSDAMTVSEFAALLGMGRIAAQARLNKMVSLGLATRTTKMIRKTTGGLYTAPAFKLTPSVPKKEASDAGIRRRPRSQPRRNRRTR